jgi:hypothetical protein
LSDYLEQALGAVAREAPLHFRVLRERMGAGAVLIQISGAERLRVCLAEDPPWVSAEGAGQVCVQLAEPDLDALLQGELTLEEALEAERLAILGELDEVLRLLDVLQCWLHGALRSPSLPKLHQQFLARHEPRTSTQIAEKGVL